MNAQAPAASLKKRGQILYNSAVCTGCSTCELVCSLYHEGICAPFLSRIHVVKDVFSGEFSADICKQCSYPPCYYACPVDAIGIDDEVGTTYIVEERCIGCNKCVEACPLMPEREIIGIKTVENKKIFFKCDLCKDRPEGPACVEYCPVNALRYTTLERR